MQQRLGYSYHLDPTMDPATIAEKTCKSVRTVYRYWPPQPDRHKAPHHSGQRHHTNSAAAAEHSPEQTKTVAPQ